MYFSDKKHYLQRFRYTTDHRGSNLFSNLTNIVNFVMNIWGVKGWKKYLEIVLHGVFRHNLNITQGISQRGSEAELPTGCTYSANTASNMYLQCTK
jgi:hypothetical protein